MQSQIRQRVHGIRLLDGLNDRFFRNGGMIYVYRLTANWFRSQAERR